ncbi:MAG: hypothetical protein LBV73_20385 [Paraburkholderia sp.]|jgi:hypothetical protein|nr:hypothetical protein [Paraburkholderia sp.]
MSASHSLDGEARAELLCYLLVCQMIARRCTGDWLRTDHLIESARLWLSANSGGCDWLERAELGVLSVMLATELEHQRLMPTVSELTALHTPGWRLDYRAPLVCSLHEFCAARLHNAGGHGTGPV